MIDKVRESAVGGLSCDRSPVHRMGRSTAYLPDLLSQFEQQRYWEIAAPLVTQTRGHGRGYRCEQAWYCLEVHVRGDLRHHRHSRHAGETVVRGQGRFW